MNVLIGAVMSAKTDLRLKRHSGDCNLDFPSFPLIAQYVSTLLQNTESYPSINMMTLKGTILSITK